MTFILSLILSLAWGIEIPNQLTGSDQVKMLNIIGLGAQPKVLSNAYPLGGYSGLELSLTLEAINTREIAQLGSGAPQTETFYYPSLTVGKGLYNSGDIFIHFTPPRKTQELTKFGASYRWNFYQALFLPLNFSLVLHGGLSNLKNKLVTRNLGGDLVLGLMIQEFSFSIGGGYANSSGQFTGGVNGVTTSNNEEHRKVESSHFMIGASYNFKPFFIGVAVDRYETTVYSVKSGVLF
jgi:hypothetical protein